VRITGSNPNSTNRIFAASVPPAVQSTDSGDNLEAGSSVQPIRMTFRYLMWVNGTAEIDLTVEVDPGRLVASGVYGPPPEAG
jgi:hypothetical protein